MRILKRVIFAQVALLVLGAPFVDAAVDPEASAAGLVVESTDISNFPEVKVLVAVEGGWNSQNSKAQQFYVKENGSEIEFSAQSLQQTENLQVVIVFDRSGSMGNVPLQAAKDAASAFVSALPAEVAIGLVSFASDATVDVPVTTDRSALADAIERLDSDGNTSLYDAVVLAASQMDPSIERRVLVVLSDGGDNASEASLESAVAAVRGLRVEMIELATPESNRDALIQLANPRPIRSTDDPAQLEALYQSVAQALVGRVEIVFTSAATLGTTATIDIILTGENLSRSIQTTFEVPPLPTTTSSLAIPTLELSTPSESDSSSLFGSRSVAIVLIFIGLASLFMSLRKSRFVLSRDRLIPSSISSRNRNSKKDPFTGLKEMLEQSQSQQKLLSDIAILGSESSPATIVLKTFGSAILAGIIASILFDLFVGLFLVFVVLIGARAILNNKVKNRKTQFIAQLPETLQMLSSMLRTGYGLQQALDAVAKEAIEPTKGWLTQILIEVRTGRDLVDAMRSLAVQMDSLDFDWVVAGIEISRETGGDLAQTLDTVGSTIRERDKLRGQVRALTAEGRMSAYVMLALPPSVGLLAYVSNPELAEVYREPVGIVMLSFAGVLMILGYIWMRKMISKVSL